MISYPTRTISVTDTPISIRATPAFINDPAALPVTHSILRYASGGASIQLLTSNPQATGTLTLGTNPTNTETIAINGVTFTFVTGASTTTNVHIGTTKEDTAAELAAVLNASTNSSINVATYSVSGAVVTITYTTPGSAGNAYTLANSSGSHVTRSAATLSGGGAYNSGGEAIDAGADFKCLSQSLNLFAVASAAGPTSLFVTDFQA